MIYNSFISRPARILKYSNANNITIEPNTTVIITEPISSASIILAKPIEDYDSEYRISFTANTSNFNFMVTPPTGYTTVRADDIGFVAGNTYEISYARLADNVLGEVYKEYSK